MDASASAISSKHTRIRGEVKHVALVVAGCAVAWTAWLLFHRDNLLLSRATAHPAASKHLQSDAYWWMSNDEFVEPVRGVAVNTRSGATKPLVGFSATSRTILFDRHPIDAQFNVTVASHEPSPDGSRMLFLSDWQSGQPSFEFAEIQGVNRKRLGRPAGNGPWLWLHDGQRLAWMRVDPQAACVEIHSLTGSRPIQTVQLDRPIGTWKVGLTKNDLVMAADRGYVQELYDKLDFDLFPLTPSHVTPKRVTLRLPIHAEIIDLLFSPTGDRLLWQVERESHPPGPRVVRGLLRRLGWKSRKTWELWTSTAEGTDFHQVGIVPRDGKAKLPYSIRWLPDGKKISFLLGKTLYTVHVD